MTQNRRKSAGDSLLAGIEKHLAAGELDAIEETWMKRVEQDPEDLAFFTATARALGKAGEADTARFLLELLDDELTSAGHWQTRLQLLRRVGQYLLDPGRIHPAIMKTLRQLYGELPSYEQMVDKIGLKRAVDDLPKIWKKAERLAALLEFDIGSIVHMEGKGAGRVEEVNMALESFKVRFEGDLELRVGFGGAAKLLEPLAPDHILRRKLEQPEELIKLRDQAPGELIRLIFDSYDGPLTGAKIKQVVAGIVAEKKWNSWWTAARKHPQVIAAPKVKRAYVWAASSEDAQGAVWQAFERADTRARIDLLRRDGARDPGLKSRMSQALGETAAELAGDDPGLTCEIWFNLERSGDVPAAVEWSPQVLIAELKDPNDLFAGIKDRIFRDRAYDLARQHRPDWQALYAEVLWQEGDARSLDKLASVLEEHAPQRLLSFLDQILSQPRKNPPAFVWFAERAAGRPEWLGRNPIRLLKQIMWALADDAFAPFRAARLVPLAESGGTLPLVLDHLTEAQAADAESAIERSPGLQGYQRQPLINAIHLRFPDLRQEDEAPLYATPEKIESKKAELKHLAEVEIPANRRAIEEARELGDLSENFEYKSARQRHEYLAARAGALNHDLSRVRPIDASQVTGDEVVIGCLVELKTDAGNEWAITILGPWESKPEENVLSSESEIAQKLLGLKVGDTAELAGDFFRVEAIGPYTN